MLVVNLFGGPCTGKTTLAKDVTARLKRAGVQAEDPPEVAKVYAQRGDLVFLADQLAVFGLTQHQLNMARHSGADVAVVDSPTLASIVYAPDSYRDFLTTFPALVRQVYDSFENVNYVVKRNPGHAYSAVGRIHALEEALAVDEKVVAVLKEQGVPFRFVDSSELSADFIVCDVMATLGRAATRGLERLEAVPAQPARRLLKIA